MTIKKTLIIYTCDEYPDWPKKGNQNNFRSLQTNRIDYLLQSTLNKIVLIILHNHCTLGMKKNSIVGQHLTAFFKKEVSRQVLDIFCGLCCKNPYVNPHITQCLKVKIILS